MIKHFRSIAATVIILIGAIIFTGCVSNDKENADPVVILRKVENLESGVNQIADKLLPPDKELNDEIWYSEEILADISLNVNLSQSFSNLGSYFGYVTNQIGHYPTSNIRKMNESDSTYNYLVYTLDNGGRLFLFSQRGFGYGYPIYMEKTLAHKDFDNIKVGDSMDKVIIVDSAAAKYREAFINYIGESDAESLKRSIADLEMYRLFNPITSAHLLSDGLLIIQYNPVEGENGYSFIVSDIYFSEEFLLPDYYSIYTQKYHEYGAEIDPNYEPPCYEMRILDSDYIDGKIPVTDIPMPESAAPAKAEDIDWQIDINVIKGNDTKTFSYSKKDAEALPLSRSYTSRYKENNPKYAVNTVIVEGITLKALLASLEVDNVSSVLVTDTDGAEHSLKRLQWENESGLLAWIENNEYAVSDSRANVAVTFEDSDPGSYIASVASITIVS